MAQNTCTLTATVQSTINIEKERCQKIYHQIYEKVQANLTKEIEILKRKGVYETLIRIPMMGRFVQSAPPVEEIVLFVCRQLSKRGFTVERMDKLQYIKVSWFNIIKETSQHHVEKRPTHSTSVFRSEKSMSKMLPPLKSLPPLSSTKNPNKSLNTTTNLKRTSESTTPNPPKKKMSSTSSQSRSDKLSPDSERKIARSHQNVLRALAGV